FPHTITCPRTAPALALSPRLPSPPPTPFPYTPLFRSSSANYRADRAPQLAQPEHFLDAIETDPTMTDDDRRQSSEDPFRLRQGRDGKSTRLNCSHRTISYAVFCLQKNSPF